MLFFPGTYEGLEFRRATAGRTQHPVALSRLMPSHVLRQLGKIQAAILGQGLGTVKLSVIGVAG